MGRKTSLTGNKEQEAKKEYNSRCKAKSITRNSRSFLTEDPYTVVPFNAGDLNVSCKYCAALHFKGEKLSSSCCHDGKIVLPSDCQLKTAAPLLMSLLTAKDKKSVNYRDNIRQYNSANAMASVSMAKDQGLMKGRGAYVLKVQGQIYHYYSSGHTSDCGTPSYARLYFIDN